jgi:hypothetical protein
VAGRSSAIGGERYPKKFLADKAREFFPCVLFVASDIVDKEICLQRDTPSHKGWPPKSGPESFENLRFAEKGIAASMEEAIAGAADFSKAKEEDAERVRDEQDENSVEPRPQRLLTLVLCL